jgi:cytochrome c-type biogenesis protein CcmH/NrfG
MLKEVKWLGLASAGVAAVLLVTGSANGQRKGGGSSGPGAGRIQVPVQKSGKVTMEDGTPPPESLVVEAMCGGAPMPIARTDQKGGFIVGRGRGADVDARMQQGTVATAGSVGNCSSSDLGSCLAGCSLRARLPGYESSQLRVSDNEQFDLGTIVLKRLSGVEGTEFSATTGQAPKNAQKAYEKGRQALEKKKPDEAKAQLEKAVEAYPQFAAAWYELGRLYQTSGDIDKARDAYDHSIKADPKFVKPYLGIAGVYHKQQKYQEAADATATLIKLDPGGYPAAYVSNAIANMRLNKAEAVEASARQAVKLDTAHAFPEAEYILGVALDAKGDSKGAAEHMRVYLQYAPPSPALESVKQRLAEIEKETKK